MSKKILYILLLMTLLLIFIASALAFLGNATPFEICVTGTFSLTSVSVGFYYWKAKAENLHKFGLDDKIDVSRETWEEGDIKNENIV